MSYTISIETYTSGTFDSHEDAIFDHTTLALWEALTEQRSLPNCGISDELGERLIKHIKEQMQPAAVQGEGAEWIDARLGEMAEACQSTGWNEAYAEVYADESGSFVQQYRKRSRVHAAKAGRIVDQIKSEFLMLKENRDRLQDAFEQKAREVLQLKAATTEPTTDAFVKRMPSLGHTAPRTISELLGDLYDIPAFAAHPQRSSLAETNKRIEQQKYAPLTDDRAEECVRALLEAVGAASAGIRRMMACVKTKHRAMPDGLTGDIDSSDGYALAVDSLQWVVHEVGDMEPTKDALGIQQQAFELLEQLKENEWDMTPSGQVVYAINFAIHALRQLVLLRHATPEPTTDDLIRALRDHVAKTMPNCCLTVTITPKS